MRKVHVFNNISLDGFFTDEKNDMSWAHKHDEEQTMREYREGASARAA